MKIKIKKKKIKEDPKYKDLISKIRNIKSGNGIVEFEIEGQVTKEEKNLIIEYMKKIMFGKDYYLEEEI